MCERVFWNRPRVPRLRNVVWYLDCCRFHLNTISFFCSLKKQTKKKTHSAALEKQRGSNQNRPIDLAATSQTKPTDVWGSECFNRWLMSKKKIHFKIRCVKQLLPFKFKVQVSSVLKDQMAQNDNESHFSATSKFASESLTVFFIFF